MIIEWFVLLTALALVFLAIGYSEKIDAFLFAGYAILMLIFSVFLFTGLDYKTSVEIVTAGNISTITPQYSNYTNHTVAFLFTLLTIVGLVYAFNERTSRRDKA